MDKHQTRREDEIARMMEVFIFASDDEFEMMAEEVVKNVEMETRREDEQRDTTLEQEAVRKQSE